MASIFRHPWSRGAVAALTLVLASCSRNASPEPAVSPVPTESDGGDAGPLPGGGTATCPHVAVTPRCKSGECLIPAGCFIMGSPPDEPNRGRYNEEQREVTLTHSFAMGEHEVTRRAWGEAGFSSVTPAANDPRDVCNEPECPLGSITWYEAVAYANARSEAEGRERCIELSGCTGTMGLDFQCADYQQTTASYYDCRGYRLPTTAEFQYAARAGTTTTFWSGPYTTPGGAVTDCKAIDHLMSAAWYCANAEKGRVYPVGLKRANPWGLLDILGNAAELTASEADRDTVGLGPQTDPYAQLPHQFKSFTTVGGGSFAGQDELRIACTGLNVGLAPPRDTQVAYAIGARLVRTLSLDEVSRW